MEPTAIYATRQGNLGGETVEMSVDAASMAHVMSILTDLYSDPTLAVIREYSTNALDSHVEAGVKRPIEVSLPNTLSPFFKVRDYGVGLSVEDIRNVYSKYGASTKRSTNEQVGMLGLGCKSALTYTQQFTVRSVKDGKLAHVAISRTEAGAGVMQVVCIQDTNEENGVEISVPVERNNDFDWKARDFFRFWEPGTVLVDGQEPELMSGIDLGDGIQILKNVPNDYVVMGNVGYRVSKENELYNGERYSYRTRNFGIVAKVAIGSVNFTPSREDLHYTSHTLNTLEVVRGIVKKTIMSKAQEMIDAEPDHESARKQWLEWREMTGMNLSELTYKGDRIPGELNIPHMKYRPDYGRNCVTNYGSISFNEISRAIFIHGYEKDEISTSHRGKMRLWADQKGFSGRLFIVTKTPVEQKWFKSSQVGSWEEVFATKRPREKRDPNDTYAVSDSTSRYPTMTAELPDDKTLIVWTTGDAQYEDNIRAIVKAHGNAVAVRLPKNRWDKFLREHSNAVKVQHEIPRIIKRLFDALTADEKLSMSINYDDRRILHAFDESRLDDPELVRYTRVVRTVRQSSDNIEAFSNFANTCRYLGFNVPALDKVESPRVKYPLIAAASYSYEATEHFYMYANTLYAKEQDV
ncbi:hypothetical protein SEA_DAUBENSKI_211 [Streptomyces phage Daubenski]|uniref:RIIA-like protein n=1 Tax=Streptomyces phage Daubenski TaxID=2653725 RepID=A0A5Q2WIH5_9CAUD|nr:RIIA lysis inhibitor [Streptomyces phage Daubenski]QGH76479.1 hypothetical protein SEA_DAUBENSKI_211 [Streptomyces phage Daubenski]